MVTFKFLLSQENCQPIPLLISLNITTDLIPWEYLTWWTSYDLHDQDGKEFCYIKKKNQNQWMRSNQELGAGQSVHQAALH